MAIYPFTAAWFYFDVGLVGGVSGFDVDTSWLCLKYMYAFPLHLQFRLTRENTVYVHVLEMVDISI